METGPKKEKSPEGEPKSRKEALLTFFASYRARPDQPKFSYEDQHKLAERSAAASEKFDREKTPEAKKEAEAAAKIFLESKEDKKHVGTMWVPLMASQSFLESEDAKELSEAERERLSSEAAKLMDELKEAQQKEHISDELVKKTLDFMDEMESQIK
jgi:hypothetical protein